MIVDLTLTAPPGTDDESTTTVPTPQNPAPGMSDESTAVTAGLGGFLVVFALALAVWVLGRDLTRRLRRMNRAEQDRSPGRQGGAQGRDRAPDGATGADGSRATKHGGAEPGNNQPVGHEPGDKDPLA